MIILYHIYYIIHRTRSLVEYFAVLKVGRTRVEISLCGTTVELGRRKCAWCLSSMLGRFSMHSIWITGKLVRKIQQGAGWLRWGCLPGCDVFSIFINHNASRLSVGIDESRLKHAFLSDTVWHIVLNAYTVHHFGAKLSCGKHSMRVAHLKL